MGKMCYDSLFPGEARTAGNWPCIENKYKVGRQEGRGGEGLVLDVSSIYEGRGSRTHCLYSLAVIRLNPRPSVMILGGTALVR